MAGEREVGGLRVEPNGAWRFEITDLAAVRTAMGDDLLAAFCQCFVHADRLTALTDFGSMSGQRHGETSVAHARNLQTMFWLVAGTLRELGLAVRYLRSQLAKRQLLGNLGDAWQTVRQIEQWEDDPQRRDLRNKLGFHVDADVIRRGLHELVGTGGTVVVAAGDGQKVYRTHLPFGLDAAFRGLEIPESEVEPLIRSTADHQLVPKALYDLFTTVLGQSGVSHGEPRPL